MESIVVTTPPMFPVKTDELYSSCYCEENVYKLCERFLQRVNSGEVNPSEHQVFAVFITNPFKETYVKHQASGDPKNDHLVIWDYHVICVHKDLKANTAYVQDFDTLLGWQVKFNEYLIKSLLKKYPTPALQTMYRVVEADKLVGNFACSRKHMVKKTIKGVDIYNKPPPKYPCIVNKQGDKDNLFEFYLNTEVSNIQLAYDFQTELAFSTFIQKYQKENTSKEQPIYQSIK